MERAKQAPWLVKKVIAQLAHQFEEVMTSLKDVLNLKLINVVQGILSAQMVGLRK